MILAAVEFLGVEWIGNGSPALEQVGPLLGSVVLALVAAYAAWLAAGTASDWQERQLASADTRHREQLDHDLKVRKDEYSRDAIDAAIVLVIDLQRQIATATQNAAWTERQRTHYGDLGDSAGKERALKKLDYDMKMELLPLGERVLEMHQFTIRLGLRLGSRHAIPTLNTDLMNKWCECVNSLRPAAQRNRRDDEAVASEKLAEEASDVQAKLTAECELWFQ